MEFRPGIAFFGMRASLLLAGPLLARLSLAVFCALAFSPFAAQAATTERVIVNRYTGLAIEGNRASFVAHPDIYGPQFGGYDPVDLARGVTYAGNPRFWLIAGQRLYLFGREDNRDAFAADPERFQRKATSRWPALEQQLAQ